MSLINRIVIRESRKSSVGYLEKSSKEKTSISFTRPDIETSHFFKIYANYLNCEVETGSLGVCEKESVTVSKARDKLGNYKILRVISCQE